MCKIVIITGLFLLSVSAVPVVAFDGQYSPKDALKVNHHPSLILTNVKTGV